MNHEHIVLTNERPAVKFASEHAVGTITLLKLHIPELNGKTKEEWTEILSLYHLEVLKSFEIGVNEQKNIALLTFLMPIHEHPFFNINHELFFGREVDNRGIEVSFNKVAFKIVTHNGQPINHSFHLFFDKNPMVKEIKEK